MSKIGFKALFKIIFLLILSLPPVFAQSDIESELQAIQNTLSDEFSDILSQENPQDFIMVIVGQQITALERLSIQIVKKEPERPEVIPLLLKTDSEETLKEALKTSKVIFLIGGPTQNSITKEFVKQGLVKIPEIDNSKIFVIARGKNKKNSKIVVFSDLRGYNNIERESARLSPLAKFIPIAYVPAVASLIGVLFTYFLKFLKVYGGKYISSIGKKSAKLKEKYLGFKINHHHIKVREYVAILIGTSVYGLAIALSYTGLQSALIKTFQITLLSCLIIFGIKEFMRLFMSYIMKIHAEFVFWIPGAISSLVSGFLGNTMNSVAYVMEFKDKYFSFEKLTKIKYSVVLVSFFVGTAFFVMNFLVPTKLYQMIMASATTSAMAEMFPIKPLGGKDIKTWKPSLWFFTFTIMATLYVLINFVI